MKVAVTSQNFKTVTGHAGKARRFLVFEIREAGRPREINRLDLPMEYAFHEFRGDVHPLDGISALITGGAGPGLVNRLMQRGIDVAICTETDPLAAVTAYVDGTLNEQAPHSGGHSCGCRCAG